MPPEALKESFMTVRLPKADQGVANPFCRQAS